ncbi:hypothetical protein TWF481_005264 [Arthrobotrys musiformis]|uniref:Uncharacterized protein n=1 Tax=Arthrobotrys musiformis TaxID=47236 RepID=A0AAV9WEP3_9PEZI
MICGKVVIFLAYVAAIRAYTIKFDVLGYEPIFSSDRKTIINQQILDQKAAAKAQAADGGSDQKFNINWNEVQVARIPDVIEHQIPGRVGRERCFNIIPPIFSTSTPEITRKDRFKVNNLMAGHEQEYFPPYSLLDPQQQWQKPSIWDKAPYLREGVASGLPKVEVTGITISSRLDPEALEALGPAGPPPLAIALYSRRDCRSRSMNHAPEAVIRYFDGEGTQFVAMDKLYPNAGILDIQSWEELDPSSDWWFTAIGEALLQPKAHSRTPGINSGIPMPRVASTGSDKTAGSNDSGEKLTPTRVHVGDAYVSSKGTGPPQYIKDVVEVGNEFEFYMADDALDSIQTMRRNWPGIEDYGYGGPNRLNPRIKMTGSEYLTEDWIPERDSESETEEVDPGRGRPEDGTSNLSPDQGRTRAPDGFALYNPLEDPLPREKNRGGVGFKEEGGESDGSSLPPLVPDSSSEEEVPQLTLQDASQLWAQSNPDTSSDSDFEALDLYRFRSGGIVPGGNNVGQEEPTRLDILEEDYFNELDELE